MTGITPTETPPALRIQIQLDNADQFVDTIELSAVETLNRPAQQHWIDISGKASLKDLQVLLQAYQLHPLLLEDMSSKNQRAKIEDYGDYVFLVLRGVMFQDKQLKTQLLYLIVGHDFVISYQPKPLLIHDMLQHRLKQRPYWYQQAHMDYLLYLFIDCWVDTLMDSVEGFSAKVDKLDGMLLQLTDSDLLPRLHRMKHDASRLRRSVAPLRDVLGVLMRNDYTVLSNEYSWYLRDTYDHCLQLMENLDFTRDALLTMMEVTLGSQSNRLNQQMRLLTTVSIVFMPLTVITGIYGMNFEHMPELRWHYGYYAVLATMAMIVLGFVVFLSRRKWL